MQLLVAQPVFRQRADLEVLHQDVALRDQLLRDRLALGLRDIQRDRALVAVHADEIGALLRARHVGRGEAAGVVAGAGALDLDHVGAEIGQHLRAGRPGQHARQVEHAQPAQWSRGKWSGGLRANGFAHAFLPLAGTPVEGPYRPAAYTPGGDAGNAGHRTAAAARGQHREPRVVGRGVRHAGHPVDLLRRAAAGRGRPEADPGVTRHRPLGGGAGRRAGLGRHRSRRHHDGLARRPHRHPLHRDDRRGDDGGAASRCPPPAACGRSMSGTVC